MITSRLAALRRPGEVVSPIEPPGRGWPEGLRAGVLEPRRGYRFRPENAWLPALLAGSRALRVADLGAGSGSLLVGAWYAVQPARVVGVEIQEHAAERLGRTLAAHGLAGAALTGDLRDPLVLERAREVLGGPADLVVANPPFFQPGWGRPSARDDVHRATHALAGGVAEFLAAAAALLAPGGRVRLVYDAGRLAEALAAAAASGFRLGRIDLLPDAHGAACRAWLDLAAEGTEIKAWEARSSLRAGRGDPGDDLPQGRNRGRARSQ